MFVAIDTETYLIQPGRLAPRLVCLTAWAPHTEDLGPELLLRDRAEQVVREWLDEGAVLVAHNAAYDMAVLASDFPALLPAILDAYAEGRVRCTRVREALRKIALGRLQHDPAANGGRARLDLGSVSLELLGERVEGKSGADAWRFRYHELDGVPLAQWPSDAVEYAKHDAELCGRVYLAQSMRCSGDELVSPDEARQTRAAFALHLMSAWGLRADGASVERLRAELEARVKEASKLLVGIGLMKKGGSRNIAAIREAISEAYDGEPPLAESGAVSYAAAVMRDAPCKGGECAADGGAGERLADWVCEEPLHTLAAISEDQGELSKYVPWLERAATAPVNARVTPLVATGRTSVSAPPVQQLPRRPGVRDCFIARPGALFVGADYGQAELVTLAQVLLDMLGHSRLAEVLQAGRDPHLVVAAALLDIDYDEAERRRKDPDVKAKRQLAKALNFGLPGGLGARTFTEYAKASWGVRLTEDEARDLKDRWLSWYPEMVAYFDRTAQAVSAGGGAFDLVQPRSGRIRGDVRFTDGCNSRFQGLAADLAKDALWRVTRECFVGRGPLRWARPVLFVHDEIVLECPASQAPEAAERLAAIMIDTGAAWCPDVPITAEPYVMRRWYKDAETVRDEQGRIQEWTPC